MQSEERSFLIRFSVRADIPDALLDDDELDEAEWLTEWERQLKPAVIRAVFQAVRSLPEWSAHSRSRGASTIDEVEVVVERSYGGDRRAG